MPIWHINYKLFGLVPRKLLRFSSNWLFVLNPATWHPLFANASRHQISASTPRNLSNHKSSLWFNSPIFLCSEPWPVHKLIGRILKRHIVYTEFRCLGNGRMHGVSLIPSDPHSYVGPRLMVRAPSDRSSSGQDPFNLQHDGQEQDIPPSFWD